MDFLCREKQKQENHVSEFPCWKPTEDFTCISLRFPCWETQEYWQCITVYSNYFAIFILSYFDNVNNPKWSVQVFPISQRKPSDGYEDPIKTGPSLPGNHPTKDTKLLTSHQTTISRQIQRKPPVAPRRQKQDAIVQNLKDSIRQELNVLQQKVKSVAVLAFWVLPYQILKFLTDINPLHLGNVPL